MRAIIATAGGPTVADVDEPRLGAGSVLVRVHAAALNRVDLRMSRGMAHGSAGGIGQVCGMEWAGEIVAVPADVDGWAEGQRVMGVGAGAFAQFTAPTAGSMFPIPETLSYEEAATLPVGLQTMHDALITQGGFTAGQSVLVQGASSGMGLMGMQIAKEFGAKLIIATSTNESRRQKLASFGADIVLNSRDVHWESEALAATGGEGVDLLADLVAGPLVIAGMRVTRVGGRMINIGRVGGEHGTVDFDLHSMRRITYIGTTFRTRGPDQVSAVVEAATRDLTDAVSSRRISMPVAATFALDDAPAAFSQMERNEHFGKLVLVTA
jgi:NADPH2:quinone reductase